MTIVDELTPVFFKLRRIGLQQDESLGIVALGDFSILNAAGKIIASDSATATLTPGERTAFLTWLDAELVRYATATGLTEYTGE